MKRRHFGHVGSYRPGDLFENRLALSAAGLHRPTRAGISGTPQEGADSIVFADAYEDDVFGEDQLIYSGSGGRSTETGKQVADQQMAGRNLVLQKSEETGLPVRVLHKVHHEGRDFYRYEGLYRIISHTYEPGKAGFRVLKFLLHPFLT